MRLLRAVSPSNVGSVMVCPIRHNSAVKTARRASMSSSMCAPLFFRMSFPWIVREAAAMKVGIRAQQLHWSWTWIDWPGEGERKCVRLVGGSPEHRPHFFLVHHLHPIALVAVGEGGQFLHELGRRAL